MKDPVPFVLQDSGRPAGVSVYTPLKREAIPNAIIRQIQQLLVSEKLMPGDKLPSERDLADALAVSRTAVREAITRLETLQILETRRGKGTFVRERQYASLSDRILVGDVPRDIRLRDTLEARACIDIAIAGFAAERAAPEHIEAIASLVASAGSQDQITKREYTFDLRFEQHLALAANNQSLLELQERAHSQFVAAMTNLGLVPRPGSDRHHQHIEIFDAVRAGDAQEARRSMTRHLDIYKL